MFGNNKWDDLLGGSSTYNFPSANLSAFGVNNSSSFGSSALSSGSSFSDSPFGSSSFTNNPFGTSAFGSDSRWNNNPFTTSLRDNGSSSSSLYEINHTNLIMPDTFKSSNQSSGTSFWEDQERLEKEKAHAHDNTCTFSNTALNCLDAMAANSTAGAIGYGLGNAIITGGSPQGVAAKMLGNTMGILGATCLGGIADQGCEHE